MLEEILRCSRALVHADRSDPDVTPVMDALNRIVQTTGPDWLFMTACYLVIDPDARRYAYANAGHHFPLHYRADTRTAEPLEFHRPPAGDRRRHDLRSRGTAMEPG